MMNYYIYIYTQYAIASNHHEEILCISNTGEQKQELIDGY